MVPDALHATDIRIRDLATGAIVANISHSIGFGFGAAFVDYDHGTLWISATPYDRQHNNSTRPFGPPSTNCGHWGCGVYVFNSSDLVSWTRAKTDVDYSGPNTDIARVYSSPQHPVPPNLLPHRYVMATEMGQPWAVNNNLDGDLSHGWITLPTSNASGGAHACPSVRYLPSDGYYYTVSGGHTVALQRSRDLLVWESASDVFIQPSPADVLVATSVMATSQSNLEVSHAVQSIPLQRQWDHDSNDADLCCEAWGGASTAKGGPSTSYVIWGADGQGSSGFVAGPEGVAVVAVGNVTLDKLLQSYF